MIRRTFAARTALPMLYVLAHDWRTYCAEVARRNRPACVPANACAMFSACTMHGRA